MIDSNQNSIAQISSVGLLPPKTANIYRLAIFAFVGIVVLIMVGMVMLVAYIEQSALVESSQSIKTEEDISSRIVSRTIQDKVSILGISTTNKETRAFKAQAYGISNNSNLLATLTDGELSLYNLATDIKKFIELPFKPSSINSGEIITWSTRDEFFAFKASDTDILVYSTQGLLISDIKIPGASAPSFSPRFDLILVKVKNGLAVLDIGGGEQKLINLEGDLDSLIFAWNQAGDSVLYKILEPNERPNFARTSDFNKILID